MPPFAGATAAYAQSPPGKPYQSFPALAFAWDGAATPTLTVTEVSGGALAATYSGQALAGSACAPQSVISAATAAGNPWEVGPA